MTILLINSIFELSIETRLPCLYGWEKKQEMASLLLAELCQYWWSCPLSADFVTYMIGTTYAIYILYY